MGFGTGQLSCGRESSERAIIADNGFVFAVFGADGGKSGLPILLSLARAYLWLVLCVLRSCSARLELLELLDILGFILTFSSLIPYLYVRGEEM